MGRAAPCVSEKVKKEEWWLAYMVNEEGGPPEGEM